MHCIVNRDMLWTGGHPPSVPQSDLQPGEWIQKKSESFVHCMAVCVLLTGCVVVSSKFAPLWWGSSRSLIHGGSLPKSSVKHSYPVTKVASDRIINIKMSKHIMMNVWNALYCNSWYVVNRRTSTQCSTVGPPTGWMNSKTFRKLCALYGSMR